MGHGTSDIHQGINPLHGHCRSRDVTLPGIRCGKLIAIPASGFGYRTATQHGSTTGNGGFTYLPNERVTFYLGAITLPAASTGPVVTPYDMGSSPYEPINVVRLLHLLFREGNGTRWLCTSATELDMVPIDFTVDPGAFSRQLAVATMMKHLGCKLIDEKAAIEFLDTSIARYIHGKCGVSH